LKKRTKKLLQGCRGLIRDSRAKVFASFFKKKRLLPNAARKGTAQCRDGGGWATRIGQEALQIVVGDRALRPVPGLEFAGLAERAALGFEAADFGQIE
jgi:hypothetical protein